MTWSGYYIAGYPANDQGHILNIRLTELNTFKPHLAHLYTSIHMAWNGYYIAGYPANDLGRIPNIRLTELNTFKPQLAHLLFI